jgi:hypothetical protein
LEWNSQWIERTNADRENQRIARFNGNRLLQRALFNSTAHLSSGPLLRDACPRRWSLVGRSCAFAYTRIQGMHARSVADICAALQQRTQITRDAEAVSNSFS